MEMTFIAQGWLREMTYVLIKRIYAQSEIAHRVLIRLAAFPNLEIMCYLTLYGWMYARRTCDLNRSDQQSERSIRVPGVNRVLRTLHRVAPFALWLQ